MGSWRKAYGALKDSTKVGLAKVNSDFKELDIAIVKATNHVECPPKERHVRKIFFATSVNRPRADVSYCIYALARRLSKTKNWIVALKTLIVVHRLLREGDPTFKEEFLAYSYRGNILHIANFKDESSPLAWDCSAWVRTYALFLEERLECFRVLKYDIETERLVKSPQCSSKAHTKTRTLPCPDLLEQLPALQQLLFRLIGVQPEGAACSNYLIQYALALVLKESFKIYCVINDGIINLVDMFFEMPKYDAIKALAVYKRAGLQAENLAEFYDLCKHLELARTFQFPTLRQPPPSFLATMEEYIREAPRLSVKSVESEERKLLTYNQEAPKEPEKPAEEEKEEPAEPEQEPEPQPEPESEPQPLETTGDLLNLDAEVNPLVAELEESNALALAIVAPGDQNKASTSKNLFDGNTSGWELALVNAPSTHTSQAAETNLAGGFDKLLLDSLYEDEARRQQITSVTYTGSLGASNPFDTKDPFAMSSSFAPPSNVQLAMLSQQQQYYQAQQNQQYFQPQQQYFQAQQQQLNQRQPNMYQQQHQYSAPPYGPSNPFGDPFSDLVAMAAPGKQGNSSFI
ncbi:putative clathrin assembly protein At5g57200 [Phragmites australis]|uniref:putative clathrin assembly protein At5g57200 n=1 Tax=Phragmites australis TaxID=29695 RepID=UPI002D76ECAB|nr:putative clathrin assembly protein At5g57200 [Phragmites australis]